MSDEDIDEMLEDVLKPGWDLWVLFGSQGPKLAHIIPSQDLCEHAVDHRCWCEPHVKFIEGAPTITHRALDLREAHEQGVTQ